ncbi:unnamed protein product [Coccothraustes coccothraustes]
MLQTSPRCHPLRDRSRYAHSASTGNVGTHVGPTPLRLMGSKGCLVVARPKPPRTHRAGGRVPRGRRRWAGSGWLWQLRLGLFYWRQSKIFRDFNFKDFFFTKTCCAGNRMAFFDPLDSQSPYSMF